MPIFEYKAYVSGGGTRTGVIDADTPREARQRLRRENVLVSEIHEKRGGRRRKSNAGLKVSIKEHLQAMRSSSSKPTSKNLDVVAASTRLLGTMLGAGIPLTETLHALIEQAENRKTETLFREIRERVTQGTSLADGLADHPSYFSELYVNMVRAGQATGNLDVVFKRLADYLQGQRALRRKVVSALTYPVMMIVIGIVVVTILMTWVVPKITGMLQDTGQTLPTPTLILIAISNGFRDYWWLGCLVLAAISFGFERIYHHSVAGRMFIDKTMLQIPLIGDMLRKQATARFTRTLSTLLQSGVPVVSSLEITGNVVGNRVIAQATDTIRTRIMEGTDIATPLKASGVFPAVVGYMVAVGEQSGELENMLDRIGSSYEEEIELATERVTSLLEPIMIVVLALVVGYIVVSIVLPILQVGQFN